MAALYELIQSLTSKEWQAVEKFLTCFSANHKPENKSWKLAKLLKESKTKPDIAYLSKKIYYSDANEKSVRRLAQRLRNKVLIALTADCHSENEESNDDRNDVVMQLKRKAVQFHYLYSTKRALAITHSLLEEIIFTAKEYEHYPILIEHLKLKNWRYTVRLGEKKFDASCDEIDKYEKISAAYSSVYNSLARLTIYYEFSGKPDEKKIISFLEKIIPDARKKYSSTNSKIILYYLKVFEMDYEMKLKNYSSARSIALELIEIVKNNKSVFTIQRLGTAYDHLTTCEMLMDRFDDALEHARTALQCIPEGNYNFALSKQWEFYALFFNHKYYEAEICMQDALCLKQSELGKFRYENFITCFLMHYLCKINSRRRQKFWKINM